MLGPCRRSLALVMAGTCMAWPQSAIRKIEPGDFLKSFSLESFGFSSSPTGMGFENPTQLSGAGELAARGLECPKCVTRPVMERTRYTLPPFAGVATWKPGRERFYLTGGVGGVNAWKPDNTLIELTRQTAFNNSWLGQAWLSGDYAVDGKRRMWLGGAANAVKNFGPGIPKWATFKGTATFHFGR